ANDDSKSIAALAEMTPSAPNAAVAPNANLSMRFSRSLSAFSCALDAFSSTALAIASPACSAAALDFWRPLTNSESSNPSRNIANPSSSATTTLRHDRDAERGKHLHRILRAEVQPPAFRLHPGLPLPSLHGLSARAL